MGHDLGVKEVLSWGPGSVLNLVYMRSHGDLAGCIYKIRTATRLLTQNIYIYIQPLHI